MILCLQPYPVQSLVVCAADVLVMPDSVRCSCIVAIGCAVARSERRSAGHATGASVGGMVTTQPVDAADDASRHS